jgi:hypothetical protein
MDSPPLRVGKFYFSGMFTGKLLVFAFLFQNFKMSLFGIKVTEWLIDLAFKSAACACPAATQSFELPSTGKANHILIIFRIVPL